MNFYSLNQNSASLDQWTMDSGVRKPDQTACLPFPRGRPLSPGLGFRFERRLTTKTLLPT
jgi:hypothetical protein